MKESAVKTARFATLVERAGNPSQYTLWADPAHDADFQAALDKERVMTVFQNLRGQKKDYGEVGFHQEGSPIYLIFPRTLRDFAGQKVVGIKYELLARPKPKGRVVKHAKTAGAYRSAQPSRPMPEYQVTLRYVATLEVNESISAPNASAARTEALKRAEGRKPDFSQARVKPRVVRARRL